MWKSAANKERRSKQLFCLLSVLWLLLFIFVRISNPKFFMDNIFWTVGVPVGICSMAIFYGRAYFKGYGVLFSILQGILGCISVIIPVYIMKISFSVSPILLNIMVILLSCA